MIQSYRWLIFYKGDFALVYGYTGDRGTETVEFVNEEIAKKIYHYFLSLENISFSIITDDFDFGDNYTNVLYIDGEIYYNLKSPKWGYYDMKTPFYKLEDNDKLIEFEFVRYKTDKKSWKDKEEDEYIIGKIDGKEEEIPYYQVLKKQTK